MKTLIKTTLFVGITSTQLFAEQPADHLFFEGAEGQPGNGKHIVLMSGDEEYRSEESMPMMAQILASQGFKCTVLFSMDEEGKLVDPKNQKSVSNIDSLDSADAIVLALRFRNYPEADLDKFTAAFEKGTPLIALRTSTHLFNTGTEGKYAKYHWKSKVKGWKGGFGRQVLGESWVAHHGKHKVEATRTHVEKENEKHPVLNGVGQIFCTSDVYTAAPLAPSTILLRGEVTQSFDPKSEGVAKKNNPMQPVAWAREYKHENGKVSKILTTTMGAASDLTDENLRRLVINGVYWGTNLEVPASADASLKSVFKPTFYGFNEFQKGKTVKDFLNTSVEPKTK